MSQADSPQERLIARLMTIYGEPKTNDPALYLEEFEKAVQGWSADILEQAGDEVIRKCTFWPRPAEIIDRCEAIAMGRQARKPRPAPPPELPPPTPEAAARARQIKEAAVAALRVTKFGDTPPQLPPVDRPAFEAMQRQSPNRHLHVDHAALTRRITGERE